MAEPPKHPGALSKSWPPCGILVFLSGGRWLGLAHLSVPLAVRLSRHRTPRGCDSLVSLIFLDGFHAGCDLGGIICPLIFLERMFLPFCSSVSPQMNSLGAWPSHRPSCSHSTPHLGCGWDARGSSRVVAPRRPGERMGCPNTMRRAPCLGSALGMGIYIPPTRGCEAVATKDPGRSCTSSPLLGTSFWNWTDRSPLVPVSLLRDPGGSTV